MKYRIISIYLPQFHPIPENDQWWGKGFTEWTNVTKAKPRYPFHEQPKLPADLGFYDLRLPEVQLAQQELAETHGIYGFCYYHYWFNGKQLLQKPLEQILNNQTLKMPFMLCWANENWSRTWDGKDQEVLINQEYSDEDDIKHIEHLLPILKDPRYIKIDNKPVVAIYNTNVMPNVEKTISIWRKRAAQEDLEIYICRFEGKGTSGVKYMKNQIDAAIEFQPNFSYLSGKLIITKIINQISYKLFKSSILPYLFSYDNLIKMALTNRPTEYKCFPCVTPCWDNTPRKKDPLIFTKSSPEKFRYWLEQIMIKFKPYSKEENFIFINAWNEWAEGSFLEPDRKYGLTKLRYIKQINEKYNKHESECDRHESECDNC